MTSNSTNKAIIKNKSVWVIFSLFVIIGLGGFIFQLAGKYPERAWQAYLINFLLWSAVAQGGLLFSMVTHITKARWSKPLQSIAESFAAFFPISFGLFLVLFLGKDHLFPWLGQDLHGKEVWLNLPFLFWRDFFGLLILYGLGMTYLNYALRLKMAHIEPQGKMHRFLHHWWSQRGYDPDLCRGRMSTLSVLYIIAYALVLSLVAFDLVMSMDPHWISTLFGAYSFVKAFYVGLGSLIILAAALHLSQGEKSGLTSSHFHDLGSRAHSLDRLVQVQIKRVPGIGGYHDIERAGHRNHGSILDEFTSLSVRICQITREHTSNLLVFIQGNVQEKAVPCHERGLVHFFPYRVALGDSPDCLFIVHVHWRMVFHDRLKPCHSRDHGLPSAGKSCKEMGLYEAGKQFQLTL